MMLLSSLSQSNGNSLEARPMFRLLVSPLMFISNIANMTFAQNQPVNAVNIGGAFSPAPDSYSQINTWPAGLAIDIDGNIIGTPTNAGVFATPQVRAEGFGGPLDSNVFTITVTQGAPVAYDDAFNIATGATTINIDAASGVLNNDTYTS